MRLRCSSLREAFGRSGRWLLAPRWQWCAMRLRKAHGSSLSPTAAWCLVSLARDPGNAPFVWSLVVRQGANRGTPGVSLDCWAVLEGKEEARRCAWLEKYGETPLSRLGISEELIEISGLHVVEWGLPQGVDAASLVYQQRLNASRPSEGC